MITILPFEDESSELIEIFQKNKVKFSLLFYDLKTKKYQQKTVPFICRDFFTDIIYSLITKKDVDIYGFQFSPKRKLNKTYKLLLVEFSNKDKANFAKENLKYLNSIEEDNGIKKTVIKQVDSNSLIFKLDNFWFKYPFLMSLYSLIIKLMSLNHTIESAKNGDATIAEIEYVNQQSCLNLIIKHLRKLADNYFFDINKALYLLHNTSGIVNFTTSTLISKLEQWENASNTSNVLNVQN